MNKKLRLLKSVLLNSLVLFFIFFAFSCVSNKSEYTEDSQEFYSECQKYLPEQIEWQKINSWSDYFFYENKKFPIRWHAIKINLNSEKLKITAFPENDKDFFNVKGKPNFFKGVRIKKFAKDSGSQIAINTSPFIGKNGTWNLRSMMSSTRKIVGVHIADGTKLSEPNSLYSSLCFAKEQNQNSLKAFIAEQKDTEIYKNCDFAFGGFFTILKDGKKIDSFLNTHDSRTAAGVSSDGKILYLLVVEGERRFKSEGLSFSQCADIMILLGANDAMEMDGGGSSSLFINQKNVLGYPALRVNAAYMGVKREK